MTIKNRFRKTMKKGISNYKRYRKNKASITKKNGEGRQLSGGGSKLSEDLYNLMVQLDRDIEGAEQKEHILSQIEDYIKENNIVPVPPVNQGSTFMSTSMATKKSFIDSIDSGIETIGSWLVPVTSKNGRKNVREISVYFYPSLIRSKKDPNNPDKPNLRFGNIMIKYNNTYADISSYFRTMTRETDDFLASIRRGFKAKTVYPQFFHKEHLKSTEFLDDKWALETSNDCKTDPQLKEENEKLKKKIDDLEKNSK